MADRRGAGEGGVYQLANGRWQGAVDLGWVKGRRVRKRITRPTRREVVIETRELLRQAQQGRLDPRKPPTLNEWMDTYFAEVASTRVRPTTLASYRSLASRHVVPALGQHRVDRVSPQDLSRLYRDLSSDLAPASIRRVHAMLRRALTVAVRWGYLQVNPATLVDAPPLSQREVEPLTLTEARALLMASADHRLHARWLVGLSLGLRQGEVLGLQWTDVELEAGMLHVRRSLSRQPDGTLLLTATKTTRSNRVIPMPKPLTSALVTHGDRQADERSLLGEAWTDSDFVFTTSLGTPVHPRNDYRAFQALLQQAGLRRVRLHDLRHTAASLLLAQGVAPRVVMEILGHSQISITMNTYSHVDTTLTRDAADLMGEALWTDND